MLVPLDSDGFLRRECPTCERELKVRPALGEEEPVQPLEGGYFCPYCGVQAPPNSWFTKAQIQSAHSVVVNEVLNPMLKKFSDDIGSIARRSGGLVSARVSHQTPEKSPQLTEDDDMKVVTFTCHPAEPVKVLDDWSGPAMCFACGTPTV